MIWENAMKLSRRQFLHLAVGAAGWPTLSRIAKAQNFPARNITIIVPFVPGGSTDAAARRVGEHMASTLGQNVLIENIGGGGGMLGTGRVARAAPDGYTLLLHQLALATNVTLFPRAPFNVENELAGVGLVNYSPMMIVGRKSLAANSTAELIVWMKQAGQRARFAHAGPGSAAHLCAALFAASVGAQVEMIPYRGGTPAISDIVAGHVDLYCGPPAAAAEYVIGGTVKGYGIASKDKLARLANVPSLVQLGFPALEMRFWQGMYAPAGTPKPILEKLNAALRLALADPAVIKSFAQTDFNVFPEEEQTMAAADRLLRSEIARWGEIIRTNKIEATPQ
jgi:tripartite-type tricarboxylate transporter receptor subunit TctC